MADNLHDMSYPRQIVAGDIFWERGVMPNHHTSFLVSMSLLAAVGLGLLLAGFLAPGEGNSLRRPASMQVAGGAPVASVPAKVKLDTGNASWSVRQAVIAHDGETTPANYETGSSSGRMIVFDNSGVRLGAGEHSVPLAELANGSGIEPLLHDDGTSTPLLVAMLPHNYGDALDSHGQPLRWADEGGQLLGYLPLQQRAAQNDQGQWQQGSYVVEAGSASSRARHYQQLIEDFSRRYNLDVSLVYAIIHSESSFSPTLVSGKSAMGLMQLLPSTASDEVHRFLYGHTGNVGFDDLCVPETNIRYGTAYLRILFTRYFQNVTDPNSREYCVLAGYNMGPNRFLRHYGKNDDEAIDRINAMGARDLYIDLTTNLPVRETRAYVAKVMRMKALYSGFADNGKNVLN